MEIGLTNKHTVLAVSMRQCNQREKGGKWEKGEWKRNDEKETSLHRRKHKKTNNNNNNTDLYKMGTLASEKRVADATKPLIWRKVSVYELPPQVPNQFCRPQFVGDKVT